MAKYLIDSETLTSIADAIREKTGVTGKIDGKDMAAEIRSISASGPLTLGEDKIACFSGIVYEVNYTLWKLLENGSAENLSGGYGYAWGSECDFSSHISQPGSYFVTCTEFGSSDSGVTALGHYVSNVVTFSEDAERWLLKNRYIDTRPNFVLAAPIGGMSYTLFVDGEEIVTSTAEEQQTGPALELSTEDSRVIFVYDHYSGWHFHPDSQVRSGSVSIRINESWLFKNEIITESSRRDLPLPVRGVSYTAFVNDEEIGTATADEWNVSFEYNDYTLYGSSDLGEWYFTSVAGGASGTVSIRINGKYKILI